MSSDTNNKRPLDAAEPESKRVKSNGISTSEIGDSKDSSPLEATAEYEKQIASLRKEVSDLRAKNAALEAKLKEHSQSGPPPLPPRDSKPVTSDKNASLGSIPASSSGAAADTISSSSSSTGSQSSGSKAPILERVAAKPNTEAEKPKHTFGGTSFSFKPMVATPTNSFSESAKSGHQNVIDTPKDAPNSASTSTTTTPAAKPVFGATSSFGGAFGASKAKKNIFADLPSQPTLGSPTSGDKTEASPAAATSTSSFGANTKFSNAFRSSMNKKSFLDDETSSVTSSDGDAKPAVESKAQQQFKQVELAPVKSTTGEEDEKSHFNATCKLFELEFDHIKDGWKERGLGNVHLNQSLKDPVQVRLVMRSNGLLRVILNSKITKTTEMLKGLEASLAPGKYLRFNSINDHGNPVQYLLKFSNQNLRDDLVEKIQNLKDQM